MCFAARNTPFLVCKCTQGQRFQDFIASFGRKRKLSNLRTASKDSGVDPLGCVSALLQVGLFHSTRPILEDYVAILK